MPDGFVLDAYPDPERREMVVWLKTATGAVRLAEPFTPEVYARSRSVEALRDLQRALTLVKGVGQTTLTSALCGLEDEPSPVLRVPILEYGLVQKVAQMVDARGNYRDFELFNADLRMTHRYFLAKGLWPLAKVRAWAPGVYRILDPGRWAHEYPVPDLRVAEVGAQADAARGDVPTRASEVKRVWVDDASFDGGDERDRLAWLMREVQRRDPDVVLTRGGDTFLLPYLYARAAEQGLDFFLGRERDPAKPRKQGKSFFSYGKIKYQAPAYALHGRVHVDRTTSFFHEEAGMHGLVDLARVANVPLQDMARLGAGTALTAIQIDLAAAEGRLVPWKKNVPEAMKTAYDLLLADRGGYIYEPDVGLHEDVVEYDFASLYPNVMVKHNISPESINCRCCEPGALPPDNLTPQLGTWTCGRRVAFIPKYLGPIIARREHFKRMRKVEPDKRHLHQQVCDVYKWLLVTSFGYQGYKNAKFGRIECHEAISAWGRETLLAASEIARDLGFEQLHGIVDSLWVKKTAPHADAMALGEAISKEIGIPCEYQGRYKWIVFLPTRQWPGKGENAPAIGALNRYYGCFDKPPDKPSRSQVGQPLDYLAGGALKVRGVELRQHSTPRVVREAQEAFLDVLCRADDARRFMDALPRAVDAVRPVWRRVVEGRCSLDELLFMNAVQQDVEEYRSLTNAAAALRQLAAKGLKVQPGDTVRYVILDQKARTPEQKVVEARLMRGDERYDAAAYERVLLRAIASLTLPFGLLEDELRVRFSGHAQARLSGYPG